MIPDTRPGHRSRQRIVVFILSYRDAYEVSPSYREIGDGCGLALSTVHTHVSTLIGWEVLRVAPVPSKVDSARTILPGPNVRKYLLDVVASQIHMSASLRRWIAEDSSDS